MTTGPWIITGIVALIVAAIGIEAYVKRNKRRALSQSQPKMRHGNRKKVELGQEATDLDLVEQAIRQNQLLKDVGRRLSSRNIK
ncbi:hypothetical protein [Parasedimentitalea psychrophila]|uniref:Uncharacterized protein n=1 Tax=Parasedimentitalea psychrophila TaxID=2997337 RepID=A0A9Y2KYC6_9RHOB|nr:hypothetical protein [Parasedimentitalea psychrophila]WIY24943.1 hypothetical protein QPJ95_21005 [Parasedimentitalea psychrophila]